jgi:uncharacterized HhH-GPD family protein
VAKRPILTPFTGDEEADRLLSTDGFALLVGMLLDQQVPMEWAFRGPLEMTRRLGTLDPTVIAAANPDDVVAAFVEKPALHRYPASMAKRVHELARFVTERYGGKADRIWKGVDDPRELFARLEELPGYGAQKARIFLAILGKRLQVAPKGWEEYAAPFSDDNPRSVADIDSPENLQRVRAWKQAQKAAKKSKAE